MLGIKLCSYRPSTGPIWGEFFGITYHLLWLDVNSIPGPFLSHDTIGHKLNQTGIRIKMRLRTVKGLIEIESKNDVTRQVV